ncbi:MAG: hypothetical protein WCO09_04355 [bacterium]
MITKVKTAGVHGPKKAYSFPSDSVDYGMITPRQHRALTDLILTNFFQDDRDKILQRLPEMTSEEASEMIFEIQSAHWR